MDDDELTKMLAGLIIASCFKGVKLNASHTTFTFPE